MQPKTNVLILCTANAARSQMAEGLLREIAGDRFNVFSAGTQPSSVHPLAVRAMAEVGIDLGGHRSKHLSEFLGRSPIHHLVIVCSGADAACPRVWPGVLTRTSLPMDDPAAAEGSDEARLAKFREVRDRLRVELEAWAGRVGR